MCIRVAHAGRSRPLRGLDHGGRAGEHERRPVASQCAVCAAPFGTSSYQAWFGQFVAVQGAPGAFYSNVTKTMPCLVHGCGGSKKQLR